MSENLMSNKHAMMYIFAAFCVLLVVRDWLFVVFGWLSDVTGFESGALFWCSLLIGYTIWAVHDHYITKKRDGIFK